MAWQIELGQQTVTSDSMIFTGTSVNDVFIGSYVGRSNPGNTVDSAAVIAAKATPPDNRFLVQVGAPEKSILSYLIITEV